MSITITSAINANDAAAPNGQSRAEVNWFWITLPIITVLLPPSRIGRVRYAPRQVMKTRIDPARMPGALSGMMIRVSVTHGDAPRSAEASSRLLSSFSSVV